MLPGNEQHKETKREREREMKTGQKYFDGQLKLRTKERVEKVGSLNPFHGFFSLLLRRPS